MRTTIASKPVSRVTHSLQREAKRSAGGDGSAVCYAYYDIQHFLSVLVSAYERGACHARRFHTTYNAHSSSGVPSVAERIMALRTHYLFPGRRAEVEV